MKILLVRAELFREDGRTDRRAYSCDKIKSWFFANLHTRLKTDNARTLKEEKLDHTEWTACKTLWNSQKTECGMDESIERHS